MPMHTVTLSEQSIKDVTANFLVEMRKQGLVLVPEAMLKNAVNFSEKKKAILKKKFFTPQEIVKYQLLNTTPTVATIKNMLTDGRINSKEFYRDQKGIHRISKTAIERLNEAN